MTPLRECLHHPEALLLEIQNELATLATPHLPPATATASATSAVVAAAAAAASAAATSSYSAASLSSGDSRSTGSSRSTSSAAPALIDIDLDLGLSDDDGADAGAGTGGDRGGVSITADSSAPARMEGARRKRAMSPLVQLRRMGSVERLRWDPYAYSNYLIHAEGAAQRFEGSM